MVLLTVPFDPDRQRRVERLPRTGLLAVLGCLILLCAGLVIGFADSTDLQPGAGRWRAARSTRAFLVAGWTLAGRQTVWPGPVVYGAAALCLASVATVWSAWGALLYLAPPLILLSEGTRQPGIRVTSALRVSSGARSLALGLAAGTFLGMHLLISASLTFGYRRACVEHWPVPRCPGVRRGGQCADRGVAVPRRDLLPLVATVGVLASSEPLDRLGGGAVPADPALPQAIEARTGAVFYLGCLALPRARFGRRSGSLLPGFLATVMFFAAYRMLGP